jgi:hypothetical protein
MATSLATHQYDTAARMKFDSLVNNYNAANASWWQLGHSFDTIIDFLDTFSYTKTDQLAAQVKEQYEAALQQLGGYDGAWFDDLGWWTIATQRAADRDYFKKERAWFNGVEKECWSRFTGNAPMVWERHKPGTYDDYRPAVEGGVWNEYWLGTPDKGPNGTPYQGPKDGDPSHKNGKGLQGIQNTVTNAVYLTSAQRGENTSFEAGREYSFLHKWMFEEKDNPLWWQTDPTKPIVCLVRERVSHFVKGKPDTMFQTKWAWTGDQGLIVGGLTDRMRLNPGERGELVPRVKQLLVGTRITLTDNNVLNPWTKGPGYGTVPDKDYGDYETGPGVFWRYVLYAWKTDSELRAFLNADYPKFLTTNADLAAKRQSNGVVELTNDVAVLVAATAML